MNDKIIVADCGATSCEWRLIADGSAIALPGTVGYNPNYEPTENLRKSIAASTDLLHLFPQINKVYYYGAGCASETGCSKVRTVLKSLFHRAEIAVSTDLWGSVRAVYAGSPVICGILGTGSNSCRYDGSEMVHCIPSLGFSLGDEGSGNHIGRLLLRAYFYREMPTKLRANFESMFDLDLDGVLNAVYQQPNAAGYLAQYARFAADHQEEEFIRKLVGKAMNEFLHHFIRGFNNYRDHEVGMVGSIAYYFQGILQEEALKLEIQLGPILQRPIEELAEYHLKHG